MAFRTFGTQLLRQVAKTTTSSIRPLQPVVTRTTIVPPALPRPSLPSLPRSMASASVEAMELEGYSRALKWSHWLVAGSFMSTIYFVKAAQWTEDKKEKGRYMMLHKSTAMVALGLIVPRVFFRLTSGHPGNVLGSHPLEHVLATASHYAAYGAMLFMPISGVIMGYYGGRGIPFYGYFTIPGAAKEDRKPKWAGTAFTYHKLIGQATEYLIPLHVGAAGFHAFRGHTIFSRINPLA